MSHAVHFYFDFISPYSWIALAQAKELAAANDIEWTVQPIVYSKVLEARGLLGPAETAAKRDYMFRDVVRCAARAGLRFAGPPAHPFRSLDALRTVCVFLDHPRSLDLCLALADACWRDGHDLTDIVVIQNVVDTWSAAQGDESTDVADAIRASKIKSCLHKLTDEALDHGVFGVPTFIWRSELFWGHDRMSHLADRLAGRLESPDGAANRMLTRPIGMRRRR